MKMQGVILASGGLSRSNSIFLGFEGQFLPSEGEYVTALQESTIVPDTNVLLDLYRFNESASISLFEALEAVRDRIWVPHRVLEEFWNNRDALLEDPHGVSKVLREIGSTRATVEKLLNTWAKTASHEAQDVKTILDGFSKSIGEVEEGIGKLSPRPSLPVSSESDAVLQRIGTLFEGKVGVPFDRADRDAHFAEAMRRIEEKIPPGYKDKNKQDPKACGDYFIWRQILEQAASAGRPVMFVTRDVKEDWFRNGVRGALAARPELVQELSDFAGQQFYLVSTAKFLEYSSAAYQVSVSQESLETAREVLRYSTPEVISESSGLSYSGYLNRRFRGWRPEEKTVSEFRELLRMFRREYQDFPELPDLLRSAALGNGISREDIASAGVSVRAFQSRLARLLDEIASIVPGGRYLAAGTTPIYKRGDDGEIHLTGLRIPSLVVDLSQIVAQGDVQGYEEWVIDTIEREDVIREVLHREMAAAEIRSRLDEDPRDRLDEDA